MVMINVLSYLVLFTALSTAAPTPRQNPEKLLQRRIAQKWALSIDRPARHSEPPRINLEAPPVDSTGISPAVSKSSSSQITPIVAGLPAWCSTEITYTNASLDDTASAAIDRLLQYRRAEKLDIKGVGWWQAANAYSSIINQDIVTGTSKHAIDAGDAIKTLITLGDPNESNPVGLRNVFNDDTLWWAIACLDGYKTYKIPELLDEAKRLWEWVRDTSFIVQTGIAPNMGGIQRKKVISDQCGLVDGVYWTTKKSEINVNSIATGLFMQTSARLYELERNPKYLDAALSAGKWLRSHTVDGSLQLVNDDGVDGNTCHVNTGAYTYNTGVYIGALTSLYTSTGQTAFLEEAEEAAASSMETTLWTDGNGVITEAMDAESNNDGLGFKSILIRNLVNLYRTTTNKDIKREIKGFVNLNFNNLYNLARSGDDYDGDWRGPFVCATSWGQLVAIDLLVAALAVN